MAINKDKCKKGCLKETWSKKEIQVKIVTTVTLMADISRFVFQFLYHQPFELTTAQDIKSVQAKKEKLQKSFSPGNKSSFPILGRQKQRRPPSLSPWSLLTSSQLLAHILGKGAVQRRPWSLREAVATLYLWWWVARSVLPPAGSYSWSPV